MYLDFVSDIGTTVESTQNVKLGGMGVELMALRDGNRPQHTMERVDRVKEFGYSGEGVTEGSVGSDEGRILLVLLLGLLCYILSSPVSYENLDLCMII